MKVKFTDFELAQQEDNNKMMIKWQKEIKHIVQLGIDSGNTPESIALDIIRTTKEYGRFL